VAERKVFWSIVTNFSRARRDSDRLRRSLEDLESTRENLDENAVGGNRQVARSERERQRAEDSRVRSTVANAARQRQANESAARSSEAVANADRRVTAASTARQRAALALEAAERRLADTEARHGRESQQYANSLLTVQRRQLDVQAATERHTAALARQEQATRRAEQGNNRFTRSARNSDSAITKLIKSGILLKVTLGGLKIAAVVGGIAALTGAISSLSAGLISVIGPLLSMSNALAAIPQLASVAAGAIGTVLAAFSGVGEALKAGSALRKDAAATAKQERGLAEAVIQAQRRVRDAREAAADAARNAYRSVRDASRALVDAQKNEYEASKRLSEARQQAVRDLEDMKRSLRDLELSERGASLSVEEARQRLNETMMDPGANDTAKAQAQLAYDEAIARLDDVKKEQDQAKKDYAKAQKKGVDASDSVIEAQQAQIDSAIALVAAQEALGDAQRDAARSQRDAAEAIGDAQRALRDANEAFSDGPAGVDKYKQALEELSPEGQKFVKFLLSMQDGLKELKFAAQDAFFPGLTEGIKALKPLLPVVTRGVTLFGTILGDIATKLGGTLGSNVGIFNRLLDSNAKILVMAGDGMNNLLIAVLNLMDAARPFTEWLSATVLGWTEYWKQISVAGNETGSTAKKLDDTRKVLEVFGGILKGLWGTFKGIGRAGKDLGMDLLTSFRDMTKGWSEWTNSVEGQNSLKEWFDAARPALHEMGLLIGDIVKMFFELGKTDTSAEVFKAIRTDLLPAVQRLLEAFQKSDIIPKFIGLLGDVIDVFTNLVNNSAALDIFVGVVGGFVDVLKKLTGNEVGATALGLVATSLASIAAIRFVGAITGVNKLVKGLGKLRKSRGLLGFAKEGVDDAGNATRAGGGRRAARAVGRGAKKAAKATGRGVVKAAKATGRGAAAAGRGVASAASTAGPAIANGMAAAAKGVGKAVSAIGTAMGKLVGIVSKAMLSIGRLLLANPWILLVAALIAVVVLIVKHWDKIKEVVSKAISWILDFVKKHWQTILAIVLGPLGLLIGLVVKHWDKIKSAIGKAVDGTLSWLKGKWDKIKDIFTGVFSGLGKKMSDAFNGAGDMLGRAVDGIVGVIKTAWNKLKGIFGGPVEWLVNTVINEWIIGNVNKVLEKIGLKDNIGLQPLDEVKFARGGRVNAAAGGSVPGAGNRDSVPALLMPGEFVMRKDAVKRIGVSRLRAMNEGTSFRGQKARPSRNSLRQRKFGLGDWVPGPVKDAWDATGGKVVSGISTVARGAWGTVKAVGGKVVDLARLGASKGLNALFSPLRATLDGIGSLFPGLGGKIVAGTGNNLMDIMVEWIKGADEDIPLTSAGDPAATPATGSATAAESRLARGGVAKFARGGLVQRFHSGGPVLGMKPGAKGEWVKFLEYMNNQPHDGTWDTKLDALVKSGKYIDSPAWGTKPSAAQGKNFLAWMNNTKPVKTSRTEKYTVAAGDRVGDVLKQFFGARYADHLKAFNQANGWTKTVTNSTTTNHGGRLGAAIDFAKKQAGKPYIWGGVGPRGYDCSGYQSAITNVIKGKNPYSRLFATGNMSSVLPRLGFKRGAGPDYTVGWRTGNPGHTSGRLGNLNVESTGNHVRVGNGAQSPMNFPNVWHLNTGSKTTTTKSTVNTKKLSSLLKAGTTVKVPGVQTFKGGRTWGQARSRFGLTDSQLIGWTAALGPQIKKLAVGKRLAFMRQYGSQRNELNNSIDVFNDLLGLKATGPKYTSDTKKALIHALAHTYGRDHDLLAYRPWQAFSSGESALLAAQNQNARDAQWQKAMTQIATWGFTDLLEDLFSKGSKDEGAFNTAIDVSTKYELAKALNDELAKRGDLTEEDLTHIIKFLGYVNSQSEPVGIRDIARFLGLSDYDTVRLFERGTKAGKFSGVPSAKLYRLQQETNAYRQGTFYANSGGQVPGTGNTDSVPAMLTPGEFVIRKKAAQALGLNNLMALNGMQHFANGGLVRSMAPKVADIPTIATAGVSSRRLGNGSVVNYNVTYDVDIHNPVAEEGTRSMLKALQRQSVLKNPASEKIREAS
jgi:phage-related protein